MGGKPRGLKREQLLFLGGGLLGLAVFVLVFGLTPLDVTNDVFCRGGYIEKDIQQHYAGWLFYRQSALQFPLCIAQGINPPAGLSVAYTDSIPLFAAFFRLLSPLLPATFQYFGWFTLLCFVLQGGFAALLLGLFVKRDALAVAASLLFLTSPILLERAFRHTSLAAQFLVLGALYYYFKSKRENHFFYKGLFLLNILAVTIHPYFLPMTYAVTLALFAEYAVRRRSFAKPALVLAADLALTALVGWAFGLFYGTASGGTDALYGYFGLNLNALWNPSGVNGVLWSRVLPAQNQVGGNYDAFAYLGIGVLLALCAGAITLLLRHDLGKTIRRQFAGHWMLAVDCAVLTLFAISHVITANGATLATLPIPGALIQLCSVFRSGGRLFWPVYYLLLLAAVLLVYRLGAARWGTILLGALLLVQVWDVSPGLLQRRAAMRQAQQADAFPTQLQSDFWQQAKGRYKHLAAMDGIQHDALHLALYAADLEMTTTDPFAARYDSATLALSQDALKAELAQGVLQADTLYLFADEGSFLQNVEPVKSAGAWCGRVAAPDGGSWYVIAPGMAGAKLDANCTAYDDNYPLRLADYTDGLWNKGVLDATKQTVCFADAPFTRARLAGATALCADGAWYPITAFDDSDPGWLMLTLDIPDATVLWDKELEIR